MALKLVTISFRKLYLINRTSTIMNSLSLFRNFSSNNKLITKSNSLILFNNRFIENSIKASSRSSSPNLNTIIGRSALYSISHKRNYSTENKNSNDKSDRDEDKLSTDQRKRSLPQLMQFPEIVWPSVIKSIKNWILITFIIRPYFDREFNLQDFVYGTKQALQVVSAKLAEGDLTSLSGLVATEAINELKNVISKMSVAQRMELCINKEDIYLSFPYQVGIMFDESNEKIQKRWVEITMVFHVLRGLKEMQEKGQPPPLNMGVLPEYRDKVSICNYRFIKEFTQGNESDWTINVINHFKPSDYIND